MDRTLLAAEQATVHPARIVPRLRPELVYRPQRFGGQSYFIVEDPLNGRFFRVGAAEYAFLSLLDGNATLADVLAATRRAWPDCGFTLREAADLCAWAVTSGLAQAGPPGNLPPAAVPAPAAARRAGGWWTPVSLQVPLVHPDRWIARLVPYVGWCYAMWGVLLWTLAVGWALRELVVQRVRLAEASAGVLAPHNWLWLAVTWAALKVLHEAGHAIVCKRQGGEVREAGVIFVLLAPLAYVDVTTTWRLSKWARIQVTLAGMYTELGLAAAAALFWAYTVPGVFNQVCFNVLTTAGVMTIVFNANPLMRFDGYYLLSDVLELPNLYGQGQQFVRDGLQRLFLGIRPNHALESGLRGVVVRCYGVASWCWRHLVLVGLVLAAATLLEGAGVILSVAAIAWWCRGVVGRATRVARSPLCTWRALTRCATISCGTIVVGAAVALLTPWPGAVVIPAVIHYAPETIVRTESDGFVAELCVQSGQTVAPGDVLAVLINPELTHEVSDLEVAVAVAQLQRRIFVGQGESAKAQVEREKLRMLESRLLEKRAQLSRLIVRAPCAGQVVGRNLASLCGTYLRQGSALVAIVDESAKEVCLSIAQSEFDAVCQRLGQPLRVYVPSVGQLQAPLSKIEPRASRLAPDPAMCAAYGGPLPVRPHGSSAPESDPRQYELLAPRFSAVLTLSASQSHAVYAGQRAAVTLHADRSLGAHLLAGVADWVDARLHRSTRS